MTPRRLLPRHREALAPRAQVLAGRLGAAAWAEDFYLAGGAALALYLGHRPAAELDLMSATNRLGGAARREVLAALVAAEPATRVEAARDGQLSLRAGGGGAAAPGERALAETGTGEAATADMGAAKPGTAELGMAPAETAAAVGLRLFHYPYPLVAPAEEIDGLAVASAADLGLMKLAAIVSRGSRRDFVDLFLLCRELPLAELLDLAGDKFGHVDDFPLLALKGLADQSATEGEAMPRLAVPLAWQEVEDWLTASVRAEGARLLS